MMNLVDHVNRQLAQRDLLPLTTEQIECLTDPARIDEAAAMLDDLVVRCGVNVPLPAGIVVGPFFNEEEARQEAEDQAQRYDAVSIEAMASDDGRSFGTNEYYVTGFNGPDAPLAAASRAGIVTYWLRGEEH